MSDLDAIRGRELPPDLEHALDSWFNDYGVADGHRAMIRRPILAALATAEEERNHLATVLETWKAAAPIRDASYAEALARADAAERRAEKAAAFLIELREAAGGSEKLCALMVAGQMRILNGAALARAEEK